MPRRSTSEGNPRRVRPRAESAAALWIGKTLRWRVTTTRGDLVIALHPDVAPWAVTAIVALVRKGFHGGRAFHRVIPDVAVQGRSRSTAR